MSLASTFFQFLASNAVTVVTGSVDRHRIIYLTAKCEIDPRMEDDMRKIITATVIVVIATVTTAWAVSQPASPIKALGGGSAVPTHAPLQW
jgi:hypothetical protein